MSISIFDYMKSILKGGELSKEMQDNFQKVYTTFMMNRLMANHPMFTEISSQMDMPAMTKEMNYEAWKSVASDSGISYIKYLMKKQKPVKDIELIENHFDVSKQVAELYLDVIDKDELKALKKFYKERKQNLKTKKIKK